jgi:hypothetical protein
MRSTFVAFTIALMLMFFVGGRLLVADEPQSSPVTTSKAKAPVPKAGSPDSPGPPESTYSLNLEDLYLRLTTGATGTPSAFTEPTTAPGVGTMYTIDEIMGVAPTADNTTGALPGDVILGKTYWGLRTDGAWGLQTGSYTPTVTAVWRTAVLCRFTTADCQGAPSSLPPLTCTSGTRYVYGCSYFTATGRQVGVSDLPAVTCDAMGTRLEKGYYRVEVRDFVVCVTY